MNPIENASSIVDVLRLRAEEQGVTDFKFAPEGTEVKEAWNCDHLDKRARAVAADLQARGIDPGDRVLLVYPAGLEFLAGFFGCLYAGAIAVPVAPPHPAQFERGVSKLDGIVRDARPTLVLTTAELASRFEGAIRGTAQSAVLGASAHLPWVPTEGVGESSRYREPAHFGREQIAYLQYTSGSTSEPRGVMVSHGNVLGNAAVIADQFALTPGAGAGTWLPHFHDMGLVGGLLTPLFVGMPNVIMPPVAFIQRPVRWLEMVSAHRVFFSGGPNFSYDLCVRKIKAEDVPHVDLSCWEVAFNGAEPIRAETVERFTERFHGLGLPSSAVNPCYGLAEATLMVTSQRARRPAKIYSVDREALQGGRWRELDRGRPATLEMVGSGSIPLTVDLAIVDPMKCVEVGAGEIGELWVAGPSVCAGYFKRPEESEAVFRAQLEGRSQKFLRTGDLAVMRDGQVTITGRIKDLMIVRGRNHYPQDVEATVERAHPGVRAGCAAAFSMAQDTDESVVVLAEVERAFLRIDTEQQRDIRAAIAEAVTREHGLEAQVELVGLGGVLKTSSGKVARSACRKAFLSGSLRPLGNSRADA